MALLGWVLVFTGWGLMIYELVASRRNHRRRAIRVLWAGVLVVGLAVVITGAPIVIPD